MLFGLLLTSFVCGGSQAQETLDFLNNIKGSQTIGGMHNRQPNSDPNLYSRQLQSITGQWPGLYSSDFQFEPNEVANRQTMTNQVITEWNNGAFIHLMWHACNPAKQTPCQWDSNGVLSSMSDWEWNQLITDGTPINSQWKSMMDDVAYYLQQMKDAGVEILFRPLHEMNQGMFWWGGRAGPNGSARLYQITHDYFTYEKGLTNIVWAWNLQDFSSLSSDLNSYDPGAQYWDVLTMDMYWSDGTGYTTAKYNALLNKVNGKPIGISECDDLPSAALLAQQPQWTFFMPWSELTFENNSNAKIQQTYWDSRVLVLNEMPGWQGYQFPNTPPAQAQYVQAEDFDNMSGVIVGSTTDESGGSSVGSIDTNDWMTYNAISVSQSGYYTLAFRVASPTGGQLALERAGGSEVFATVNVPATGGWQNWQTVYVSVYFSAGSYDLGVKATQGGWNFNWFSYQPEN